MLRQPLELVVVWALLAMVCIDLAHCRQQGRSVSSDRDAALCASVALGHLEACLRDLRFRTAGVLLQQFCAEASAHDLEEAQRHIQRTWPEIRKLMQPMDTSSAVAPLIEKISRGLLRFAPFADTLVLSYASGDEKRIRRCFENEWPVMTMDLIKPLSSLREVMEDICLRQPVWSSASSRSLWDRPDSIATSESR